MMLVGASLASSRCREGLLRVEGARGTSEAPGHGRGEGCEEVEGYGDGALHAAVDGDGGRILSGRHSGIGRQRPADVS